MGTRSDADTRRLVAAVLAPVFFVAGMFALVTSIQNNPLEGWGMLLRGVAGHALLLGAVEAGARAAVGRPSAVARAVGAGVLALILTPAALLVLLMTKESGPSWSLAALMLAAWFAAWGVAMPLAARRPRR